MQYRVVLGVHSVYGKLKTAYFVQCKRWNIVWVPMSINGSDCCFSELKDAQDCIKMLSRVGEEVH